ncbi:MAG TPA: pantoate--beta-alanine ligase [Spirochaetota bacterium]|nr:pantoate--beta-alanine ligase [Spirochaetota bacterium]
MIIVHTIQEVRDHIKNAKKNGKTIGFVPTMGYLHKGHLSLVELSRQHSSFQVMSIFVNKMQFNDMKDFETYPRELQRDYDLAAASGVDLVFSPDDNEMYNDPLTFVDMNTLTETLCGAHRPGHFRGVFTVVSKLFNIIQPDIAVFGQKDIQQVISIEKMVSDLNFPVKIIIGKIFREDTGLAMSSRNKHLNDKEKLHAPVLYSALQKAAELIQSGEQDADTVCSAMRAIIETGNPDSIDYISCVSYQTLQPVTRIDNKSVIAIAAYFGNTRLIDNMIIDITDRGVLCVY